jgi:hypothetical protein
MGPPSEPSSAAPAPGFRLGRILAEHKANKGSYSALAEAIEKSNPADREPDPKQEGRKRSKKRGVDRRKLRALVEGDPHVVLSLQELRALDRYLEPFGEGLAFKSIFENPDLLQTLADSRRVTFLLGSKPEKELRYFSHWDVLAMAEIQRGINSSEVSVRLDIEDVQLQKTLDSTAASLKVAGWTKLLGDKGPSLVCLGSTRTSPATEAMLCRMFQRPECEDPPLAEKQRLPFHFAWKQGIDYVFPSYFHLYSDDIYSRDPDAAKAISEEDASAIVTAEDIFLDRMHPDRRGYTYGVCVAQRRRRGQVWLVLAGVTGIATFVAAKLAQSLATRLHEQKPGQDSDIYWAVIRALVAEDPSRPLVSVRTFAEEAIVSGPHPWRPGVGGAGLAP